MRDIGVLDVGSDSDPDAMWRYAVFVSQVNDEKADTAPNMAWGKGR